MKFDFYNPPVIHKMTLISAKMYTNPMKNVTVVLDSRKKADLHLLSLSSVRVIWFCLWSAFTATKLTFPFRFRAFLHCAGLPPVRRNWNGAVSFNNYRVLTSISRVEVYCSSCNIFVYNMNIARNIWNGLVFTPPWDWRLRWCFQWRGVRHCSKAIL